MKFTNNFKFLKEAQTFGNRILQLLAAPFQMVYRKVMQKISPSSMLSKVSEDVREEIKNIADFVTDKTNSQSGVADFLYKYVL